MGWRAVEEPGQVVLEPLEPVRASVIWLHGLGADGHDLAGAAPLLGPLPGVRLRFPHAPIRPVTVNGGLPMRAWYDVPSPDLLAEEDAAGLEASARRVLGWVVEERAAGIPGEAVALAGFSQGAAVSLLAALLEAGPLAGVAALSGYLPRCAEALLPGPPREVFLAHGSEDPVVPFALGRRARRLLEGAGHRVLWWPFPGPHTVTPEELAALGAWLRRRLGLEAHGGAPG
ncbi:MAG: carboxylesterase [Gammaproteobacteria bacterium]|nr:MAG: carboxylesterase [Gammaproteobacteria bacterium]